ncbi:PREDICTED: uncharacterized protein LOC104590926 [Nelumbo nucifera]|uniref:Uncharacterized protein n=2 Tax=Nelumbo nucifera TaxID=4432 RepID=A0A822ZMT7_NELNU|nr:PREDICTED: uncharacterized protein LOC104590926 [Nelumbo nucifera]DAD44689.1 TPA_asm: hypothetical protein HUJ06_002919 [Nelumbo nucifera]
MRMELQYAVNLLSRLQTNRNYNALNTAGSPEFYKRSLLKENIQIGLDRFQDSMYKMLELYNRESMKETMLRHEETFKEQVRELHRLYNVQKMLMSELRNKEQKLNQQTNSTNQVIRRIGPDFSVSDNSTGFWSPGTGSQPNYPFGIWNQPSTPTKSSFYGTIADPGSQDRCSSSGDAFRIPRGFDLERPAKEDISAKTSVIEDHSGPILQRPSKDKMIIDGSHDPQIYADTESNLELTLTTGCGSRTRKPQKHHEHSSLKLLGCRERDETRQLTFSMMFRSDQQEEFCDTNTITRASTATFDRESLQQPQWFFQALSFNRA